MKKIFGVFERAYCISLPKNSERRARAQEQFQKIGIEVIFVDGVTCKELSGFPSLGARGCYLAHLSVWQRELQQKSGSALVFEDDVLLPRHLRKLDLGEELRPGNWDFFYFGYLYGLTPTVRPTSKRKVFKILNGDFHGAHAYGVNRVILEDLVDNLERIAIDTPMHFDGALTTYRLLKNIVEVPALGYRPVIQCAGFSDVTPARQHLFRQTLSKIKRKLLEQFY